MKNKEVQRRSGATRRTFLSASAVTAVAAPIVAQSATASAAPAAGANAAKAATSITPLSNFDPDLRALLRQFTEDVAAALERCQSGRRLAFSQEAHVPVAVR